MLDLLRRSRLLSLALLLATPGAAGTVIQAAHSCPARAPWLSRSGDAPDAHHHGSHGSEPDAPAECHCIGACHAASAWAAPTGGPVVPIRLVAQIVAVHPADTARAPAALPYRFLPPATAPPLV
ncbi:MAG: hypothetical protein ACREOF_18440 [Gemmatimonadales bacterium]